MWRGVFPDTRRSYGVTLTKQPLVKGDYWNYSFLKNPPRDLCRVHRICTNLLCSDLQMMLPIYLFILSLLFILPHYCAVAPQIYCAPTWRSWWQRVYCAALEGYSWGKCTAALSSSSWRGVLVWPLVKRSAAAGETVRRERLWVVWPLWPWVLWGNLPRTVKVPLIRSVELSSDDGRSLFY